MRINLTIDFYAVWGQTVYVCGSVPQLGNGDENKALELNCISPSLWGAEIEIENNTDRLEYFYLIKDGNNVVRREWGNKHILNLDAKKDFVVNDIWDEQPLQKYLYTSGFTQSFFKHDSKPLVSKYYKNTILLQVKCPYIDKSQALVLSGNSTVFGEWLPEKALHFAPVAYGEWQLAINAANIKVPEEYKLAILDIKENKIVHWEDRENRIIEPLSSPKDTVRVDNVGYHFTWLSWKAAGISIPVFSLRSQDSFGVGEFSDLKKLIDWAAGTNQKFIQILPINDTTITHTWTDSYPYNAISIYALHPIYLGLHEYPLNDKKKVEKYKGEAAKLNSLKDLDYDNVLTLKLNYCSDLFKEVGAETLTSSDFKTFYKQNEEWLFPYACFSHLRDKNRTARYTDWEKFSEYNKKELQEYIDSDTAIKNEIERYFFIQYLLHKQLVSVKEYAHKNSVILKGDIPIGISRDSVEAWVEPHLFNLDTQTGAPPDDFSVNGQNWGFPTYNWDEMEKTGYMWWKKRFRKMADYFDAYRIDHILGFFRIWEIPQSSVQGLLGHFSPALPLSAEDIRNSGLWFDEYRMLNPYIYEDFLWDFFGEYTQEVIDNYLHPTVWKRFELNSECDTQVKIKNLFLGKTDAKSIRIRNGLYGLCNEVLFVKDKKEPYKYHPRITAQYTYSYRHLEDKDKQLFNRIYDDFFYRRHTSFWRGEAMKKLPALISSTSMLVCGEDLGMIPESVPSVMNELQILSLEIERMPKSKDLLFEPLNNLPYLSVCTTSTHDMAPIRAWWHEDRNTTQAYYNQVLWKQGEAPADCSGELCRQILINHLNSPAMLVILPLQDWLSIDEQLRRPDPNEERINIPAIAQHYWRYRMHITLEDLIKESDFNRRISEMITSSGRR